MALQVKDMLQRPHFKNAKVLAGKEGLNREVIWAHIIEIEQFSHLLNGQEAILTTGIGWANDEEKCLHFLQQLLNLNASALCIELVVHAKQLPESMLHLAEKHNFPIISFTEEVRFIDITKDLHEQILGKQEDIWVELEYFHRKLNKELVANGAIGDFLRLLHQETNKRVALHYQNQYRFFPSPAKKQQDEWIEVLNDPDNQMYAHLIYLLNSQIGKLTYLEPLQSISRFDELALKRCSEIINQYLWRHHLQVETEQLAKNTWILDAIKTYIPHQEIVKKIQREVPGILIHDAIIGVKPEVSSLIKKDKEKNSETRFIMLFRSILHKFGFELFITRENENDLYILFIINQQTTKPLARLKAALHKLRIQNEDFYVEQELMWISFGKAFKDLSQISRSYQTALSTLDYRRKTGYDINPFYSHLGIYRIIDQIDDRNELKEIISDYLSPLLEYDQEKGSELVKTLEVYLQHLGQKNETAQQLHIVRQTLYHRLNKIEQLLGPDYMQPQNRFMIEFAIQALNYV